MALFTQRQLTLIADAVEDYAVLIDEDSADECAEILDIIEAEQQQEVRVFYVYCCGLFTGLN